MTELIKTTPIMTTAGTMDGVVLFGTFISITVITYALKQMCAVFAWEFFKRDFIAGTLITVEYRIAGQSI